MGVEQQPEGRLQEPEVGRSPQDAETGHQAGVLGKGTQSVAQGKEVMGASISGRLLGRG